MLNDASTIDTYDASTLDVLIFCNIGMTISLWHSHSATNWLHDLTQEEWHCRGFHLDPMAGVEWKGKMNHHIHKHT